MSSSGGIGAGSIGAAGGVGGTDASLASLEDCYTNIFHITELTGLKWCCLTGADHPSPTPSSSSASANKEEEPVLRAYTQCMADGLLCAWRRRAPPSAQAAYESPAPKRGAPKELWLFWYSAEEPKHIEQFTSADGGLTISVHSESADMESRVEFDYEARILFFKALNTAIERRLLTEGFVRFGRWLCRPLELHRALARDDRRALPRFVNAVRFHFFLHRDSLVCASLCVQRQPALLRLGRAHLEEPTRAQPVILAPWSIRAQLVPGQRDLLPREETAASSKLEEAAASSPLKQPTTPHQWTPMKREPMSDTQSPLVPPVGTDDPPPPSSSLAPKNNNSIDALLDRQWAEWKRLYAGLAEPVSSSVPTAQSPQTTPITTAATTTTSRSSSRAAAAAATDNNHRNSTLQHGIAAAQKLPRLVVVEVNGHRMLYPSQFVAILADELLPATATRKTADGEEVEAQGSCSSSNALKDSVNNNNYDGLCAGQATTSSAASSNNRVSLTIRTRRRKGALAVGVNAARRSMEDALLRQRKEQTTQQQQMMAPSNTAEQRTMDEFNYDYARREFCYCRLCPGIGGGGAAAAMSNGGGSSLTLIPPPPSSSSTPSTAALISSSPRTAPTPFHRHSTGNAQLHSPATPSVSVQDAQLVAEQLQQPQQPSSSKLSKKKSNNGSGTSGKMSKSSSKPELWRQQQQHQQNKWVHGSCASDASCSSSGASAASLAECPTVPDWTHPVITTTRRAQLLQHQQQLSNWRAMVEESSELHPSSSNDVNGKGDKNSALRDLLEDDDEEEPNPPLPLIPSFMDPANTGPEPGGSDGVAQSPRPRQPTVATAPERWRRLMRRRRRAAGPRGRGLWPNDEDDQQEESGRSAARRRMRVDPPNLDQLELVSVAFANEDSALFSANPSGMLPPMPKQPAVVQQRQQLPESQLVQQQPQSHQPQHQSILERLLMSPAPATCPATIPSTSQQQDMDGVVEQQQHQSYVPMEVDLAEDAIATTPQTTTTTTNVGGETRMLIGDDADCMPNAETPPALLDTSGVNVGASTSNAAEIGGAVAEEAEAAQKPEEEEEERMMAMTTSFCGESSVGTSPAGSMTSPAMLLGGGGPSSVGGPASVGPAPPHRMVPVASAMMLRDGPQSLQHQPMNSFLSPPASNERIDFSVGSNHSQQQQHPHSVPGAAMFVAGASSSQIPHDTLSRIYPTPPTPMQPFSPFAAHNQQVQAGQQQRGRNLLDTMAELADKLRQLPAETPLYDACRVRPFAMFGSFAGDLLDERLVPEERIQRCCQLQQRAMAATTSAEQRESRTKQMRDLNDQLYHRRKRDPLQQVDPLKMPSVYTKRARLGMAARLAADKAGGDAGLDARLQELERLRFRVGPSSMEEFQAQFAAAGIPTPQWPPWMNGPPFPPTSMPTAMLLAQHHQQRFPMPPPFGPSGMFPPGIRLPPHSMPSAMMGAQLQRMASAAAMNPMLRSPPSASASMASPTNMLQQQQQQQMMLRQQQQQMAQQQQMMGGMVPMLSRSPSLAAIQQQQQDARAMLQRRGSSMLMMASPAASTSTAPTPGMATTSAAVNLAGPAATPTTAAAAQPPSAITILWEGLMQGDTAGATSLNIVLHMQDTMADLHYDMVFDACPLCCCNSNIRSAELGVYIGAPRELLARCDQLQRKQRQLGASGAAAMMLPKQWSGFRIPAAELQKCNCGFSAVRHRYLCGPGSGLFADDIAEAGGFLWPPLQPLSQQHRLAKQRFRFNAASAADRQFMDLLRHLSLTRDLVAMIRSGTLVVTAELAEMKSGKNQPQAQSADYIQSPVDAYELNGIMDAIMDLVMSSNNSVSKQQQRQHLGTIIHPWGYQTANRVSEPRDVECLGVFEELKECIARTAPPPSANATLSGSPAAAAMIPSYSNGRRLEQLTLRAFARKGSSNAVAGAKDASAAAAASADDANGRVEPIPHLMAMSHAEREPVLVSAQVVRDWDRLELMPVDQPKDVLWLAVVSDVNVVAAKCKIFMEELSNMYERRCRLGIHVRVGTKDSPRDGILRVGRDELHQQQPAAYNSSLRAMIAAASVEFGDSDDMRYSLQRLRAFVEGCQAEWCRFFTANDQLFERRAFHESVYRQQQRPPRGTSLATVGCADAAAMPPPAVPSGGPASMGGMQQQQGASGVGHSPTMMMMAPHSMAQQQQTSPAAISSGPNSVPILHGGDPSPATAGDAAGPYASPSVPSMAAALQKQTAEEQAALEDKLAADLNVIMALECPNFLPHVIVCYVIYPFGSFGSADAGNTRFNAFAHAVLLRAWNEFLNTLPAFRRIQLQLELVPLRAVYNYAAFIGGGGSDCSGELATSRERASAQDSLKQLAFGVYAQARMLRPQVAMGAMSKSMTRFGPMERMKDVFAMVGDSPLFIKYNCNPFVLVPPRSSVCVSTLIQQQQQIAAISAASGNNNNNKLPPLLCPEGERVLLLAYCLLPGDDWLCAGVTDERGALLDTALINLRPVTQDVPPQPGKEWRHRLRHSQIADALQRLWQFAQGVMLTQEVRNWRLVIGRMGKLGHGEFKQWTELLSKRNLRAFNASLKGAKTQAQDAAESALSSACASCTQSHGWAETPALLSACLVSTEPEPHLRVMASACGALPGDFGASGAAGGSSGGGGASGTAGGTNGGTGSAGIAGSGAGSQGAANNKPSAGATSGGRQHALLSGSVAGQLQWSQTAAAHTDDRSVTHIMVFQTILNVSLGHHLGEDPLQSGFDDVDDFVGLTFGLEQNQDEMQLMEGLDLDFECAKNEEDAPINNQPMAIGYTVSTAPLPSGLPASFWHCIPAARASAAGGVAHLKSSLHINTSNLNQSDDYGGRDQQQQRGGDQRDSGGAGATTAGGAAGASGRGSAQHPLDAVATDDVLRYVLETYNALSWLSVCPVTGARRTCMPLHMQAVQRLHQSVAAMFDDHDDNGVNVSSSGGQKSARSPLPPPQNPILLPTGQQQYYYS